MGKALYEAASSIAHIARAVAREVLSPSTCSACEAQVPPNTAFCSACAMTIERYPVVAPGARDDAAFFYGGALAEAVRRYKYGGRSELAEALGELLSARAETFRHRIDWVTSVPIHPRRLVERGFDQAALLARPVARRLGVPWRPLLVRVRDTSRQASLGRTERGSNVVGAFRVSVSDLSGARVLLVDDVRTTGATLEACTRALGEAGAREPSTLVLAAREDAG